MKLIGTPFAGVLVLEPTVFSDDRGFFLESYDQKAMLEAGIRDVFVQDNHSYSVHNVLRGLHYQTRHSQGKLVRVIVGEIFDVAVDLRRSSATFGKWFGVSLSGENKRILRVPAGCAHGFCVSSESAHVLYKTTDFYNPESEQTIAWNDPDLNIKWPLDGSPIISGKDSNGSSFRDAEKFE